MAKKYTIEGVEFVDPTVTVYNVHTEYENEVPVKTIVDVLVMDENDSTNLPLNGATMPATGKYPAVKSWAQNELKRFE